MTPDIYERLYNAFRFVSMGNWNPESTEQQRRIREKLDPIIADILAAAPPDAARTVYQWKSQLAHWMSDYIMLSTLDDIHVPGDRMNVAWFLACKLTDTPVTDLDTGANEPPDAAASMQRVLEAADGMRKILVHAANTAEDVEFPYVARTSWEEYDAAVSALRAQEGQG